MATKAQSLAHTRWLCKYHIVFTPKYRRKAIFNQYRESIGEILSRLCEYNRHFGAEGYYISTVGLNEATIKKYITEQEIHDKMSDKISIKEYEDPFKGGK